MRARRRGFALITTDRVILSPNPQDLEPAWVEVESMRALFGYLLSNKARLNPLRLSLFVVLACSWRWIPLNLARAWAPLVRAAIGMWRGGCAKVI